MQSFSQTHSFRHATVGSVLTILNRVSLSVKRTKGATASCKSVGFPLLFSTLVLCKISTSINF